MTAIDRAYDIFKSKLQDLKSNSLLAISESDTRSKIIDTIFKDVLFWNEDDIERERFVQIGYYDYEISTAIFRFVVEAKKSLVEFKLPEKNRKVRLKTIYKANKEVIDQIRSYIFERGLLYGIITNGNQFIIGKFNNTDGSEWQDNEVLIYQNLDVVDQNFIQFYETISKEFVSHNGRFKLFEESNEGRTIVKSSHLKRLDDELIRNKISPELIPIITEVFEEINNLENLNDQKLLEECYVKNEDIKKYNSELGFIFSDLPPTFDSRINPVQNTDKTHEQLKKQIVGSDNKLADPIIIIGGTGSGKSTFINYFIENVLDNNTKKNRPILYLDFRNETESTISDTRLIYQKLLNQLYDKYPSLNLNSYNILKTIYKVEIENKKNGVWSQIKDTDKLNERIAEYLEKQSDDPLIHLNKISSYLIYQCNKRLCVVLDNADQLKESIQKEVFILGHSLHRTLKVMILLSLREGYFFKFKNKPPFDAYHSTIFHITAPPYREVLKRRIKYVIQNFRFQKLRLDNDNMKVDFAEGSLSELFENLYKALFNSNNSEIMAFLEETSYPNVRNGLEKFKFFLLSGHTKSNMYMAFQYSKEGGGIPIWEFVKSVALESNYYYQTSKSTLFNLFYPSKGNRNHFTKIRLLEFIIDNNVGITKKNNYIKLSQLIDVFTQAGYTSEIIIEELNLLYSAGLIFTSDFVSDIETEIILDKSNEIGITQSGVYYVKQLITKFYYYDLVLQDTPIYNDSKFSDLSKKFPESDQYGKRDLYSRILTVKTFLDYLISQENLDHNRKEGNYSIPCLNKQIMDTAKQQSLNAEILRLERSFIQS